MTRIIAQKKERYRLEQQGLMAEVLKEHSASSMFELDGQSLPEGIAVRRAPEASSDEPKQPRSEEEQLKRPQIGLPSSAQDAAALIQADNCPSYQRVMEDNARSGYME